MSKADAIKQAKAIKRAQGVPMVVVNSPIDNAEDDAGPWGFCPQAAADILYRHRIQSDDVKL